MKNLYTLIFTALTGLGLNAQIINIPDPNFKNVLVNTLCVNIDPDLSGDDDVDTNNDGEIQVSEALAVTYLVLNNNSLTSIEGISQFSNLVNLRLQANALTQIDVSALPHLEWLECSQNPISELFLPPSLLELECFGCGLTSLDLTNVPLLRKLECQMNALSTLDLSSNTGLGLEVRCDENQLIQIIPTSNLYFLSCTDNLLTSLDLSSLTNLHYLSCNNNQLSSIQFPSNLDSFDVLDCSHNLLTTLDTSQMANLIYLNIGYNQLTSVTLSHLTNLYAMDISGNFYTVADVPNITVIGGFICNDTQLIELDLPGDTAGSNETFTVMNNSQLQSINAKNGKYNFCYSGVGLCVLSISNNPNLQFVCVDENELFFSQQLIDDNNPALVVSTYCSFTPGGDYNTITGNIQFDLNNTGCLSGSNPAANIKLRATTPSSVFLGNTFSNVAGQYTVYSNGFYSSQTVIIPEFENPYYTITPPAYTSLPTGFGNTDVANFCIAPNGVHPDLKISIIPLNAARPGFDADYKLAYQNKGTETQSGSINLGFDDALLDLVSSNPATSSQSTNNLNWNFTNLAPFESREITLTLNVNSPQETPAVNNGDVLNYNAFVTGLTDETPNDNTATLHQTVVGSFDPNDKIVAEGASINPEQLGDFLHYTIRFQNTGSFAAENVVVKDLLENNFDLTSLQIIGASHAFRSTLTFGNQLEFFFENINLPPSSTDETGSHGYVTFKIKPKNTVVLGNTLQNSASIYFDFNFPIVTEPVSTVVSLLGVEDYLSRNTFSIYPNPVNGILNIESNDEIRSVDICNNLGQVILKARESNTIDVSNLASGIYFIKVISDKEKSAQKFIKL